MKIDISIIYVYYNCPNEIKNSIKSLEKELTKFKSEIIIVDNNSEIPIPQEITNQKKIKIIINKENKGYGTALNQGAKSARGKYLLLLNPDTIFLKHSVKSMISKMETDASIGILGPQILDENEKIQNVGSGIPTIPNSLFSFSFLNRLFPNNKYSKSYYISNFDRKTEKEIPAICGACMLIRKKLFEKVNGLDEQFFMYFEEVDLCFRIKKLSYKILYYPKAQVIHLIGRSSNNQKIIRKNYEQSRFKFFRKYNNIILALSAEIFLRLANIL